MNVDTNGFTDFIFYLQIQKITRFQPQKITAIDAKCHIQRNQGVEIPLKSRCQKL